jgi:chromosome segregation ATPase
LTEELEIEVNALNEELRTAKRVEDSLNDEIQELREKAFSGGRDSEYLRKMQSENSEFKQQIVALQSQVDSVSAQRDRLTREINGLQGQLNETRAETQHFEGLEKEFGSVRAERDDLRKSTMAAQINVAKLKAQVNDLTSQNPAGLEQKLEVVTRERDSLRMQLDDTKRQLDTQMTRLRTVERNLQDARDDLVREQERAQQLLSLHPSSPNTDKTRRLNGGIRKLEDLLQQSRLRQAELGKVNATQLDEIDNLNRRINRLEGELDVIQGGASAQVTQTGRDDRGLHKQLTIAKGQLAELKSQLSQQEREFEQRLEEQLAELKAKNAPVDEENAELKEEVIRLKERQNESVQTKVKLEEQIRSLTRKITRLESDLKLPSINDNNANDKDLFSRLTSLKKELELVRLDAEQKESKSLKQIRRLDVEIDNLRDHIDSLTRELHRTKKDSERQTQQSQLIRRQLQDSKEALKRLKARTIDEHAPSALTMQVEKRHTSELRGLGKQIRYLKAKLFREESFRLDLQFAKKFFLMQIGCFESWYTIPLCMS